VIGFEFDDLFPYGTLERRSDRDDTWLSVVGPPPVPLPDDPTDWGDDDAFRAAMLLAEDIDLPDLARDYPDLPAFDLLSDGFTTSGSYREPGYCNRDWLALFEVQFVREMCRPYSSAMYLVEEAITMSKIFSAWAAALRSLATKHGPDWPVSDTAEVQTGMTLDDVFDVDCSEVERRQRLIEFVTAAHRHRAYLERETGPDLDRCAVSHRRDVERGSVRWPR